MEYMNIDIENGTVFIEKDGHLFKVTNVKQVFDALDQDGDGLITLDEFRIIVKEKNVLDWRIRNAFKKLDTDKDGKINFYGLFCFFLIIIRAVLYNFFHLEWLQFSHKLLLVQQQDTKE